MDKSYEPTFKNAREIIDEIGTWAARNWPDDKHHPDLGVVEEIGETVHCVLKRLQKIRGFDDPVYFNNEISDAFADASIYLMHYCYKNGLTLSFLPTHKATMTDRQYLCDILRNLITILQYTETVTEVEAMKQLAQFPVQRIWNIMWSWANQFGINLEDAVRTTWWKVQQRDWVKNPTNAHVVQAPEHVDLDSSCGE